MKRSGPPRRSRPMARSGRIKAKPRSKTAFERVYGGLARVQWMQQQRCAFCGRFPTDEEPSENMHVTGSGGMGRKADAHTIVPACARCHDESHHGIRSFCAKRGITRETLAAMAMDYDARWRRLQGEDC